MEEVTTHLSLIVSLLSFVVDIVIVVVVAVGVFIATEDG